jgi:hypothetical protein
LPIPELPTPPNGSSGTSGWIVQSLTAASPDSVASRMRSAMPQQPDDFGATRAIAQCAIRQCPIWRDQ